jgi:PAS domain S-box-containing protein
MPPLSAILTSLAVIYDAASTPAACVDAAGRILYANLALRRAWTGSSTTSVAGEYIATRLPNRSADRELAEALSAGKSWTGTFWGVLPGYACNTLSVTPLSAPDDERPVFLVHYLPQAAPARQPDASGDAVAAARYVVAFSESADGIALLDREGRIEDVNRQACRLFGLRRDALVGEPMTARVLTCDLALAGQPQTPVRPGHFGTYRRTLRRGDGTLVRVELRGRCLSDGRVVCFLRELPGAAPEEPSKRGHLRQSEAEQRAVFDACFQFIGLLDPQGILLDANRSSLDFLGISAAEVLGKPFWETPWWSHNPAAAARVRTAVAEAAAGQFVRFEASHPGADGALLYVDFSLKPLYGATGEVVYLVPEGRDITRRRATEEALQRSEARFRSYFELNLIGMAMTSPVKGWVQVNDRMCDILGYTREELSSLTWAALTYPEDLAADEALFNRVLAGELDGYDLEKRFVRKDGEVIHTTISVKCQRHPDGSVESFVSLVQDISDRKRAEAERLRMERRMLHTQKLESVGVMAGGIAHDFNNLLTAISGNLELARTNLAREAPSQLWIERAQQASRRAADLTRQMLAYSGRGPFLVRHLDLNQLVLENTGLFQATMATNVALEMTLAPDLPPIYADPGQIQQVLMNLITNAVEAVGEQHGRVRIATGVTQVEADALDKSRVEQRPLPGAYLFLEVVDDGCGMDRATMDRLFDPFFTTKFTGRGLGMSAVLGIIRGHGGALFLDSAPGQGTSIRVLFPPAKA